MNKRGKTRSTTEERWIACTEHRRPWEGGRGTTAVAEGEQKGYAREVAYWCFVFWRRNTLLFFLSFFLSFFFFLMRGIG